MRELGITIQGTWLEERVAELYEQLDARSIRLHPHVWLSDEWFSPGHIPGFAIPFYLAHPRLLRLERSQMLDAEGASREECMRIMRHESGHAVQHAFQLQRRRRWQQLFGRSSTKYPTHYRPNPASKRYVQHLRLWYAQAHPDEDFAETFAVWLRPKGDWKKRYAGWPALKKLEFVDEMMTELRGVRPVLRSLRRVEPLSAIRRTLGEHYAAKRKLYSVEFPDIYDRELRQLFSDSPRHATHELASRFLRRHRNEIRRTVARWTGEYQFTLDIILSNMIGRCRELRLRAVGPSRQLLMDFAVLLTAKTMHFLYSEGHRDWIAL
jgi:hypothetical protein